MNSRKKREQPNVLKSLEQSGDVPTVPTVPAGFEETLMRARVRAGARAHVVIKKSSGNSGNSGNSAVNTASTMANEPVPTFSETPGESGNSGNSVYASPADLSAALRLPVTHLPALSARLTYRLSHELGPVAWTSHPDAYVALRASCAAFSPVEFVAAVAAGESGVASSRHMATWVAKKRELPAWRLSREEALCWGPREPQRGFGWWPGNAWCEAHDVSPRRGWTVGYALAYFSLTPVSVEIHPAETAQVAA